jgi:hypothetical protein
MFSHLMHLYANFQMGHLGNLECSLQHSQMSSHQPLNMPLQNHHLKNPKWTFCLFQNNSQICPNSALKKTLNNPILHTQTCPICDLKHLAPKPKKLPQKTPHILPLICQIQDAKKTYVRWHIKEK